VGWALGIAILLVVALVKHNRSLVRRIDTLETALDREKGAHTETSRMFSQAREDYRRATNRGPTPQPTPRPRRPKSELDMLSQLWQQSPDVSAHFDGEPRRSATLVNTRKAQDIRDRMSQIGEEAAALGFDSLDDDGEQATTAEIFADPTPKDDGPTSIFD
jgi:hypothetical protein